MVVKAEWDWLSSKALPAEKKTTRDRISGEAIEWLTVPVEEYAIVENSIEQSDSLLFEGNKKNNPTSEDVTRMQQDAMSSGVSFNSEFFSPLKGGNFEMSNMFAASGGASSGAFLPCAAEASSEKKKATPKEKAPNVWGQDVQINNASKAITAAFVGKYCQTVVKPHPPTSPLQSSRTRNLKHLGLG